MEKSYFLLRLCNQDEFKFILSFEGVSFGIKKYFCSGYKCMTERRQVMIGTLFLFSVGTKAALACLSLYLLNLLFSFTYQLKSLS